MNLQELHKKYLEYKTIEDCDALAAVNQDGDALRYVQNQTEEICLAAVKENDYALKFVQNQTEEICLAAVKENDYALKYVNPVIFKNMAQDLTVEEISKKLGYNVRIIK